MRKLIWGCAAAGVALAGGLLGAAYHAYRHPDTMLGQCARGAASQLVVPSSHVLPLLTQQGSAEAEEAASEVVPAEPMQVGDEEPTPEATVSGAIEAPAAPAVEEVPAPIVIHEEEQAPVMPFVGGEMEQPSTSEKSMPPACVHGGLTDGPEPIGMPYCEEGPAEGKSCTKGPCGEQGKGCTKGGCEACEKGCPFAACCRECPVACLIRQVYSAIKAEMATWGGSEEASEPSKPECGDSETRPPQSGCPHSGACPHSAPTPDAQDSTEQGKPPMSTSKKVKRLLHDGDACPRHFDVDTMEYRASDGSLYDYQSGGPL